MNRFSQVDLPTILDHFLQTVKNDKVMKSVVEHLAIYPYADNSIFFDAFEKFIYNSNSPYLLLLDRLYESNAVFITWIGQKSSKFTAQITFLHTLNTTRFHTNLDINRITIFIRNAIKHFPNKFELVLSASLNTGSLINFMSIWKLSPQTVTINPQFKFPLHAQPHILGALTLNHLLTLHDHNFIDLFASLNGIGGPNAVLEALNDLTIN